MIMIIPACIQNFKRHRMIKKSSIYVRDSEKLEEKKHPQCFFLSFIILVTQKAPATVSVLKAGRNLARGLFGNTQSDSSGSWHPLLPRKETEQVFNSAWTELFTGEKWNTGQYKLELLLQYESPS